MGNELFNSIAVKCDDSPTYYIKMADKIYPLELWDMVMTKLFGSAIDDDIYD